MIYKKYCIILFALNCPIRLVLAEVYSNDVLPEIPISKAENHYTTLFLSTNINSTEINELVRFYQDQEGQLYIRSEDLEKIRIRPAKLDNTFIPLDEISDLKFKYDLNNQTIKISIPENKLIASSIDLNKQPQIKNSDLNIKSMNALILNYSLYNTLTDGENSFSGTFDTLYNSHYGNFNSGFLYRNAKPLNSSSERLVRLNSFWQKIDAEKIQQYTIGDFISHTPDWGNSVRLAGLQWSSAYAQRSDIVTTALPQFSGSAALPSSLDLYVNQQKIYSGEIPSGPFDLKSLPFISGNEVALVTTDITGQQIVKKQAYYFSPKILAKDIHQFSVDLGFPRYNFANESNQYDETLFAAASSRYGLSHTLTLNAGLEASSDGLVNLGIGAAKNFLGRGVITASVAGSNYDDEQGLLSVVGLEGRLSKDLSMNMSYQKASENYHDLARVSEKLYLSKNHQHVNPDYAVTLSSSANEIFRAGLNLNINTGVNVSTNYSQIQYADEQYKLATLNVSANLSNSWSIFGSIYKDFINDQDYGGFVALRFTPSAGFNSISSISRDEGSISYRQEVNAVTDQRIGGLGLGASVGHSEGQSSTASAYVNYRARPAYLTAQYNQYDGIEQIGLSATGALVATQGRLFAAHEIGDSYAIVTNAGPHSQILNGGVNLGETDKKGRFFISHLSPYEKHQIFLDPQNLPLDWQVDKTSLNTITRYRQGTVLDFQAHKVISATVILHDQNGQALKPGYSVTVNQQPDHAMVGYGGEVFIRGLLKDNLIEVDLLDQGICSVSFKYAAAHSAKKKMGPLLCQ